MKPGFIRGRDAIQSPCVAKSFGVNTADATADFR
jgi:hypothetical protein